MGYKVKRFSVLFERMFGTIDKSSDFWKKKLEEFKRVNPNHPKIKKIEQQLQYALEEEGKSDPKKAEEAAKRRAQGYSTGYKTKNTYNAANESKKYEESMKASWRKARDTFNSDMRRKGDMSFNKMAKNTAKIEAVGLATVPTVLGAYAVYDAQKKKKPGRKNKRSLALRLRKIKRKD
jgi:hypothetical protein